MPYMGQNAAFEINGPTGGTMVSIGTGATSQSLGDKLATDYGINYRGALVLLGLVLWLGFKQKGAGIACALVGIVLLVLNKMNGLARRDMQTGLVLQINSTSNAVDTGYVTGTIG